VQDAAGQAFFAAGTRDGPSTKQSSGQHVNSKPLPRTPRHRRDPRHARCTAALIHALWQSTGGRCVDSKQALSCYTLLHVRKSVLVRGGARQERADLKNICEATSPRGPSDGRTFGGGRIAGLGAISDGRPIPQTQPAARESRSVTGRLSSSEAVLEAFVSAPSTTRTNNQTNRKQGSQISATAQRALCASDQPVLHAAQLLSVQHITGK
jgi:hypothetical protein